MRSRPQGKTSQSKAGSSKLKFPSDLIGQGDVRQLHRRAQTTSWLFVLKVQVCNDSAYALFIFSKMHTVFVNFGSVNGCKLSTGYNYII